MPRAQGLLGIKPGIIFNSTHQHQQHRGHQQHLDCCKHTTFARQFFCQIVLFHQTKLRTLSCPVRPSITDVVEPFD